MKTEPNQSLHVLNVRLTPVQHELLKALTELQITPQARSMNTVLITVLLEQAIDTYAIQLRELSRKRDQDLSPAAIERIDQGLGKLINRGGIRPDSPLGLAIAEFKKEADKAEDLTQVGLSLLKSSLLKKVQAVIHAQCRLAAMRAEIAHMLLDVDEGELARIPADYSPRSLLEAGVSPQAREEKNWRLLWKISQECDEFEISLAQAVKEEIELRSRFWNAITHLRDRATDASSGQRAVDH